MLTSTSRAFAIARVIHDTAQAVARAHAAPLPDINTAAILAAADAQIAAIRRGV